MSMEAQDLIENRLEEIDREAARLRRALAHLDPSASKRRQVRPQSTRRRTGKKRAARGEREKQLLDTIEKMPGASPNELADTMEIVAPQVHGLLRKAESKKMIVKKGQGFALVPARQSGKK
jgi:hypothetical protein